MDRRQFLNVSGAGALGSMLSAPVTPSGTHPVSSKEVQSLKAIDVHHYLRSLCEVSEPSVDRIVIGDPETKVTKIGTAWMPYWKTCREASLRGVNTLIVHEPTFYTHWDLDEKESDFFDAPSPGKEAYLTLRERKKKWIEDRGMVIIRCHDVIDKIPEFGIPFGLGKLLGFNNAELLRSRTYFNVYGIDPKPAIQLVKEIAARLKPVGQPGVAFYGSEKAVVRSIGVGTGCICDPMQFMDLKPDLFIGIDDTIRTWIQTVYAEDTEQPLIVINHGTSEEFGVRMLNAHLKQAFPNCDVVHFEQGCGYKWIVA